VSVWGWGGIAAALGDGQWTRTRGRKQINSTVDVSVYTCIYIHTRHSHTPYRILLLLRPKLYAHTYTRKRMWYIYIILCLSIRNKASEYRTPGNARLALGFRPVRMWLKFYFFFIFISEFRSAHVCVGSKDLSWPERDPLYYII